MAAKIKELIGKLEAITAKGSVSTDPENLAGYKVADPIMNHGTSPSAVIVPGDADELKELIMTANREDLKLVPVSSAGSHHKGGISCNAEHVVVDLSSWKKISHIDRRNRVCTIEPGVTYGELIQALEPHGMTVSMPLAPRSTKSVMAAIMDREPSTWPNKQWDVGDPVGSTEFIFGGGDLFRTGAAGGPGSLEKQRASGGAQKAPLGPSQTDFHRVLQGSQGTMGILSWITMRTEVKPKLERTRLVGTDDLEKLIPFVYQVQRPWLGEHSFILNAGAAALLMSNNGNGSYESIKKSLPAYVCLQNIAGFDRLAEERVAYQLRDISKMADSNGLSLTENAGDLSAKDLLNQAITPCGPEDWRHKLRGHCLSLFFQSTLDRSGKFITLINDLASAQGLDKDGIGIYLQPVVQNHACHIEFMVPYDDKDQAELDKMREFEKQAVEKLMQAGAFFSRPYGSAEKAAFERNGLNTEVLKKVKAIFDPQGVLNPGKFGL